MRRTSLSKKELVTGWSLVFFLVALIGSLFLVPACSPSITGWTQRGGKTLDELSTALSNSYERNVHYIAKDRLRLIKSNFLDIKERMREFGSEAETQPAEAQAKWDTFVDGAMSGLIAVLDANAVKKAQCDEEFKTAMKLIGQNREAFQQIERLNESWVANGQQVSLELAKIQSQLSGMKGAKE